MEYFEIENRRYLGCKTKLLSFIEEVVDTCKGEQTTFLDLFGGTGVVSEHFSTSHEIIVNDLLMSNYYAYQTFLSSEPFNEFKIEKIINYYNNQHIEKDNYYSDNFGDTYLSKSNMRKVGFIRDDIDMKYDKEIINFREKSILITSLLYSIDKIANTVGHYDAYITKKSPSKELKMLMPKIKTHKPCKIYHEDANVLAKKVKADICYLDPPYNSRQYCDLYHFLENVAENKKPEVFGKTRKMDRKNLKSNYSKAVAPISFASLIEEIDAKYILLSYNNDSDVKISDTEILEILNKKGETEIFTKEYEHFNSGKTLKNNVLKERIFKCKVYD